MTFVYKQMKFVFVVFLCLSVNILLLKGIKRLSGSQNRFVIVVPEFQKKTAELHRLIIPLLPRLFSRVECHHIKWQRLRSFYSLILFWHFISKRLILSFAGDAFPGASSPFLSGYVSASSAHGSSDPAFRTPNSASLQMAQLWASHPHEGKNQYIFFLCVAKGGKKRQSTSQLKAKRDLHLHTAAWTYWV